jgi:hypothetical protein
LMILAESCFTDRDFIFLTDRSYDRCHRPQWFMRSAHSCPSNRPHYLKLSQTNGAPRSLPFVQSVWIIYDGHRVSLRRGSGPGSRTGGHDASCKLSHDCHWLCRYRTDPQPVLRSTLASH